MTERLYYREPEREAWDARLLRAEARDDGWRVVLDRTCFYPGGGGQPADRGWIDGEPVLDVWTSGEDIIHVLARKPPKERIRCRIDMDRRRDFMEQHTGQHIVSAALWRVGKYTTVSVHMGVDTTTIDLDVAEVPLADLTEAESLANRIIRNDLPLDFVHTDLEGAGGYDLRKPTDREGAIRLVRIADFDTVACGGLHLDRTGRVGMVKAVGVEKIRSQARTVWKMGGRALEDYRGKDALVSGFKAALGAGQEDLTARLGRVLQDLEETRRRVSHREHQLADMLAERLRDASRPCEKNGLQVVTESWRDEQDALLKMVVKRLMAMEGIAVCLLNRGDAGLRWIIGHSSDVHLPFEDLRPELLAAIDGRGGGRAPLWEGSGAHTAGADTFLQIFRRLVCAAAKIRSPGA